MATKRVPIRRDLNRQISGKAVEIFRRMRRLTCTCPAVDWARYWEREQCPGCKKSGELDSQLHEELRLRPWQWPAVEDPHAENPYPLDHVGHKEWHKRRASRPEAFALFEALAALAEAGNT